MCFTVLNVLVFIISVSYFLCILKNNCPGVGVLARFICPRVGVLHFLCAQGVENSPFQKIPEGLPRGGMVRLGID